MDEEVIFAVEDRVFAKVYQKFPAAITRGKGAILYDVKGKEYIDCMGGYGVGIVGHCHPKVVKALKEQCERLITCHGSYYNDIRAEFLEKLIQLCPKGLERVFLCNSGAEAVECALKVAAKFTGRSEFISMVRGYHGKTLGALSVTWDLKYRESFQSIINSEVKFVPYGRSENVAEAISDRTAAVIVEPVQGEGGVHVAPEGFLESIRRTCDENGALMIVDEIQTGLGRTGRMWACEHWGVVPDIMCIGKGLGGGVPIGATVAKPEIMDCLKIGEHTSTFGGNPIACAAASAVLDIIVEEKLVERARTLGEKMHVMLEGLVEEFKILREVRGLGLMIGLECRLPIQKFLLSALYKGLLLLYSGKNVIRLLPPLVIGEDLLEKAVEILREVFTESA
ncbi:MAG: aspartate aminotransferase family protein [Nitrososphaerota archaeon]|nr:aspartate aminotransferase family protein [Candidatus Bathyarchaeota archaeon]MDW8048431.1 aspartate aminotransferase family protein [Nitrososphaerota archaeon]